MLFPSRLLIETLIYVYSIYVDEQNSIKTLIMPLGWCQGMMNVLYKMVNTAFNNKS